MKKLIFVFAAVIGMAVTANAQTVSNKQQEPMKDHVCTQACHDTGKHVYAHGEKGHVCGKECKTETTKQKAKGKKHVCTQACHDTGKHVYAHGEKGHVCTEACKNGM